MAPQIMKVAVPLPQHSPILGHRPLLHIVCNLCVSTIFFVSAYLEFAPILIFSHSGFLTCVIICSFISKLLFKGYKLTKKRVDTVSYQVGNRVNSSTDLVNFRFELTKLQIVYKEFAHSCHKVVSCIASEYAVVTVCVNLHVKLNACLNQSFRIFSAILIMYIVVSRSMN